MFPSPNMIWLKSRFVTEGRTGRTFSYFLTFNFLRLKCSRQYAYQETLSWKISPILNLIKIKSEELDIQFEFRTCIKSCISQQWHFLVKRKVKDLANIRSLLYFHLVDIFLFLLSTTWYSTLVRGEAIMACNPL